VGLDGRLRVRMSYRPIDRGHNSTQVRSREQVRSGRLNPVRLRGLNIHQRIILVIGLGAAIFFFGGWVTTRGALTGWVAYAPLSNTANFPNMGLHPWVRLLIWLALILVWLVFSVAVLRSPSSSEGSDKAE
jgi:hypothetical protein